MNRWIRKGAGALALLLVAGAASAQAAPRMVFVNSQRIMAEAPGIQQARATMQQEIQQMQQEIEPLRQEYQTLRSEYNQQQAMLSAERRREQQQAIVLKEQELQEKAAQLEERTQVRQQELLQPQLAQVTQVIETLREERGYSFIFDSAAGILAADPSLDITGEVLRRLQGVAAQ